MMVRDYRSEPYPLPRTVVEQLEREHEAELRRQRRARLRAMAWRAVQALKDSRLAGAVEQEIRNVGGGVQALAMWEAAIRDGRELTEAERASVSRALASTPVDWALRKANDVIDQAERAVVPLKHGGRR